jgi:hypothetical protein
MIYSYSFLYLSILYSLSRLQKKKNLKINITDIIIITISSVGLYEIIKSKLNLLVINNDKKKRRNSN